MKNWLRIFYVSCIVLSLIIAPTLTYAAKTSCVSFGEFFRYKVVVQHQPLIFTAAAYPGFAIAFHLNQRTGEWTLAAVADGAKEVCTLATGDTFTVVGYREA